MRVCGERVYMWVHNNAKNHTEIFPIECVRCEV